MVNRTGQGRQIPTIQRGLPALVSTPRVQYSTSSSGADTSQLAYSYADTLSRINGKINDRLDAQAAIEGRKEGARDGQSGLPELRDEATIRGQAYNVSARDAVNTQFELQSRLKLSELEELHTADPAKFSAAASGYFNGTVQELQAFDPEIAQQFSAEFQLRHDSALTRINERKNAIIRDQQMEGALRLQMSIQDELQQSALEMMSGDPATVRMSLDKMMQNSAKLMDIGSQIGPDGRPLFSASQRIAFEKSAEDMTGEAIGMGWMQAQDSPVAAYYQWRKGEAMIEVADDEGNAQKVNLKDMLGGRMYQQVQKSFMDNLRSDLALQNQIEAANDRAFKDRSDAVYRDLSILAQDGGLSLNIVEAAKGAMEPEKYLALRELAKTGGASVSKGTTVARLLARSAQGIDVRDEARVAYAGGDLTSQDFIDIFEKNTSAVSSGTKDAVTTGRNYVGESLGKLSTELGFAQSVTIPQAESEYEVRINEFIAKNERSPSHRETLDIAREVVRRYSFTDIQNSITSLPLPQFMPTSLKLSRDLSVQKLQPIIQKTNDFYLAKHNGDTAAMQADEEYRREADLLKDYFDRLQMKEEDGSDRAE